jgi:ubiquinone/menaquinone biosynthesis C-methylase UbiE
MRDAGCGRGLLLIGAAKQLTSGKATGLDIWQEVDQSGNRPDTTLGNAAAEGVSGKVEIRSGDMRLMPFEDQTFDVIVSSMAIHNIYDKAEREKALEEIVRVLKPGGRLAVIDFANTDEYTAYWKAHGISNAQLSGARWVMFPPVRVVTGTKS